VEATLLLNIYSYTHELYGTAGEKVTIVSDHINVLIVRGVTGTFPVHVDLVKIEEVRADELHRIN
jgi:hypothetical protein